MAQGALVTQQHSEYAMILLKRFKKCLALVTAACLFLSTSSIAWAQTFAELGFDITAPSISHEVPQTAGIAGQMQSVSALITDNVAVKRATVHYIRSGAEQFQQTNMTPDISATTWVTTIDTEPADEYVLYYVVAEDEEGNRIQKGGQDNPLKLKLTADKNISVSVSADRQSTPQGSNTTKADESKLPQVEPKWIMIGLGVVIAGLLMGSSGGGGSDGTIQSDDSCCTVTFNVENVGDN